MPGPLPTTLYHPPSLHPQQSRNSRIDLLHSRAISDGYISKKGRLKGKGKFEVGSKKDVKVYVNRIANIFVRNKGQQAGKFV